MTALRAEILSTLEEIPENQLEKVLEFMKKILVGNEDEITPEMKAYERLNKNFDEIQGASNANYEELLKIFNLDYEVDENNFDYRDEVAKEVLRKYASLG